MKTGEALKKARIDAGITQAELAKRLGVTPQTVSQYERGIKNPKVETLARFADALGIDFINFVNQVDYLEDGKGNIYPGAEKMREFQMAQKEYQEMMKSGISENNLEQLKLLTEKFEDMAHDLYDTELLAHFHRLQDVDKEKVTSYCQWLADTMQSRTKNVPDASGPAADDAATDDPKE